jgi:hypothetical protein
LTWFAELPDEVTPGEEIRMRATRLAPVATALAVALLSFACGSKDSTGPDIALSLEEVGTLATELSDVMFGGRLVIVGAPVAGRLSLAMARVRSAASPFNGSWSCPLGGTASIASTYDTASTATVVAMSGDATLSYSGCKTAHFTTSGSFHAFGSDSVTQASESAKLTAGGSLTVNALDGRSGVCAIDLTMNGSASGPTSPVYVVSGSACGVKLTGTY